MAAEPIREVETVLRSLPTWQGMLLVVGTSIAVAIVLGMWGDRGIRRVTNRVPGDVDRIVLGGVHPALYVSIALFGTYAGVQFYDIAPAWQFEMGSATVSIVAIVWAASLARIGRQVSNELTDNRYVDQQVVPIIQNVYTAIVVGVGVFVILAVWRVNVAPLLASAGIAGIVVGLAARDAIANFFGSIALYLDGTYAVGDFVILETGERGRVEDISVRSTVVRTRDDILVTVPNAALNNAAIVNESSPKRRRRISVPVGVAYGTDLDAVESILMDVATDEEHVLERPPPRVRFREFGGSALQFELLCWIPNPAMRARVVHRVNWAIYERFQDEGIDIPFPQRDVSVSIDDRSALTERSPRRTHAPDET